MRPSLRIGKGINIDRHRLRSECCDCTGFHSESLLRVTFFYCHFESFCSLASGGPWLSDAEIGLQIGITSWGYNGCSESNCQCCVGYPRMAANIADTAVFEWIETVQQNYDFKFLNIANLQIIKSI